MDKPTAPRTVSLTNIEQRRQMYRGAVALNDDEIDVLLECARACRQFVADGGLTEETDAEITAAGKKVNQ